MEALYNSAGRVVGYKYDNYLIDSRGRHVAFIREGSVYNYSGHHVGWWRGDYARGSDGGVAVWQIGATGLGVIPPIPQMAPIPPIPSIPPIPPIPAVPPIAPVDRLSWSNTNIGL